MHPMAIDEIVAVCRKRSDEGDCPTVERPGAEVLEDAVIELARQRDAIAEHTMRTLADAFRKYAPDLADQLVARWNEGGEALERLLAILRGA